LEKIVYMICSATTLVRRVFMTNKHSETVKPSWFGESIGHYENGDTLVVDTIGLQTKNSYVDNYRTPHTEKLACHRALSRSRLTANSSMRS